MAAASLRSLGAKKNLNCCCAAGREQKAAKTAPAAFGRRKNTPQTDSPGRAQAAERQPCSMMVQFAS
jgi:hypothetical protein